MNEDKTPLSERLVQAAVSGDSLAWNICVKLIGQVKIVALSDECLALIAQFLNVEKK